MYGVFVIFWNDAAMSFLFGFAHVIDQSVFSQVGSLQSFQSFYRLANKNNNYYYSRQNNAKHIRSKTKSASKRHVIFLSKEIQYQQHDNDLRVE